MSTEADDALEIKRRAMTGEGPRTERPEKIEVRRLIPATPAEVFEAWRDPEVMRRWYFPGAGWSSHMVHDFEPGGLYSLEMKAPDGAVHLHSGEYREITPVERISFTWNTPFVQDTLVTVHLRPAGDDTDLLIVHEFPAGIGVDVPGLHGQGWTGTLEHMLAVFRPD
jgi:uncharacterized protein YndB with AHSA1/START domain